jgi:SAM-dependent methyltransferase
MHTAEYVQQHRGDLQAYARYLANMDAAMRQKVAATAAHLPCIGTVADMGMGSGSGSEALAALYPRLQVVGLDVNPTMVELASRTYQRPNLSFRQGDIAERCCPPGSLDGVVNSSVLHHVTSYNGYRYAEAARALRAQAEQLRTQGTLIVRDFLAPPEGAVELRIPVDLLPLWEKFASGFRGLLPDAERGCAWLQAGVDEKGWLRLKTDHRCAVEFVLRKDYTQDWDSEILEEYTYFTQDEFEAEFRRLGLRVLISTPLRNPWIVENRFEGQFELYGADGAALDYPPTNYLIVGEKVAAREGVEFRVGQAVQPAGFLRKACYRHRHTDQVYDLICRPHLTVDVLPFFVSPAGNVSVVVRHSYPRPILTRLREGMDGLRPAGFTVEPVTALQGDAPLGETVEELLQRRAGIEPADVLDIAEGDVLYPSPGGLREEVRCVYAQVQPITLRDAPAGQVPWSQGGQLRALDAHQLLRSAQVNGLPDHRVEMHIFGLLRKLGKDPGPWVGDSLKREHDGWLPVAGKWEQVVQRAFVPVDIRESPGFLQVEAHEYEELDSAGEVLRRATLESVLPAGYSPITVAVLPMAWDGAHWWAGLQWIDLPAAQAFAGNSGLWVAPAWRVPLPSATLGDAGAFVRKQLHTEFGLEWVEQAVLGGPYFPSPGATPELVYPWAIRVRAENPCGLHFFRLDELMTRWESVRDGHLRCLLLRAWLSHRGGAE